MKKILLLITIALASFSLIASTLSPTDQEALKQAEEKVKATFQNIETVLDFRESPIPGLYELNLGGKIIYYYPEKDFLVFGSIVNKEGVSLTQEAVQRTSAKMIDKMDSDIGISIGDPKGKKIIEVIDPDCPYCKRYHSYIQKKEKTMNIHRVLIFEPRIHTSALPKIKHILCSKNPQQAYSDVMDNGITDFTDCPESEALLEQHVQYIDALGLSGTPSFVLGKETLVGFKAAAIDQYLSQ